MSLLRRTCREAATLLVAREDRALDFGDKVALRLHLLACGACQNFDLQMLTTRRALQRWRNYTSGELDAAAEEPKQTIGADPGRSL